MNDLGCNCRVDGVGDWSGFLSGVGEFFSSGIGLELAKTGLAFGVGYGIRELTQHRQPTPSGQPVAPAGVLGGGTTVNPAGSIVIPQASPAPSPVAQSSTTPEWVMPVAIAAGLAALLLALRK